jgi:hypothetical protein
MSITTPKSLTETIGLKALRKKVEEEIGLLELTPTSLNVPVPFDYRTFQPLIPSIEGIGVKCQDTTTFIYKSDKLFNKYLADYIATQIQIDKIVLSEHDLFQRAIQQTNRFNHIRHYLTTAGALGPLWLEYAIPRPVLTSYGYTTYFISSNPRFQPIVTNHQSLLSWIFTNAHDIAPKLLNRHVIEQYIQYFDREARALKDRQYGTQHKTTSEIYYNYTLKHFVNDKPRNIPVLHNYMRLYEQIAPRPSPLISTKPAAKQYTRRGSLQPVLPSLIPPTYPTGRATLKRRSPTITITTPTPPVIKVNTPRPLQRRNTRRVRSPITNRPVQAAPGYRPPSPYYSPVTTPNGSTSSANSFVTARGN